MGSNTPTSVYQAEINDNVANNNGDYGFYADTKEPGKGNSATDNGTMVCFHVKC